MTKEIKKCPYYRDSERESIGIGLGFCDLDGFHAICDGDIGFCEKPDRLKTELSRREKTFSEEKGSSFSIKTEVISQNIPSYDVLVVDDDPQIRSFIVNILSSKGQRCDEASDGIEALKMFEEKRYDVIISDIVMPGMDGITFLGKIIKRYPHIPVMIMTGHLQDYSAEMAIRFGAREFIKKPFSVIEFLLRFQKMMKEQEVFRVIEGKIKESEQYVERLKMEIEHLKMKLNKIS